VNLQKQGDTASYAGRITAENSPSGPYRGTSLVWFPSEGGSVAGLVNGTDGFGADAHILGRPGYRRRLKALLRLHEGRIWVKPDLLDLETEVPSAVSSAWPEIPSALKSDARVIYAATTVRSSEDGEQVADLLDLFFDEHGTPLTGEAKVRWNRRTQAIAGAVFPSWSEEQVLALLRERRFVVLEGPPGTGNTRLAWRIADRIGAATRIQFIEGRAGRVARRLRLELLPLLRDYLDERMCGSASEAFAGLADRVESELSPDGRRRPAIATVASGRRRVRLLLVELPFGFRSPDHRESTLADWRPLLAA
jgi:hypothetical protein